MGTSARLSLAPGVRSSAPTFPQAAHQPPLQPRPTGLPHTHTPSRAQPPLGLSAETVRRLGAGLTAARLIAHQLLGGDYKAEPSSEPAPRTRGLVSCYSPPGNRGLLWMDTGLRETLSVKWRLHFRCLGSRRPPRPPRHGPALAPVLAQDPGLDWLPDLSQRGPEGGSLEQKDQAIVSLSLSLSLCREGRAVVRPGPLPVGFRARSSYGQGSTRMVARRWIRSSVLPSSLPSQPAAGI